MEMSAEELRKARETGRMPHKHRDLIKAWADGAEIQVKAINSWVDVKEPYWTDTEYRIKPKALKYRTVLMATLTNYNYVATCNNPDDAGIVEASNSFIKWLGDWVEVEV